MAENVGYKITFDGFGFNDEKDPHKRRLATLPAVWKDEGARQQFGHEVTRAVNSYADLLAALEDACLTYAVHGDNPPEKWLEAIAKAKGGA